MKIRPVRPSDLSTIALMETQMFTDPWPESSFVDCLENSDSGILIAEIDKIIAGYAVYFINLGEAHLANLAISPKYRGKSIAKSFINDILKIAKESKCEYIFLDVRPSNSAAISLYKKFEFYELYRKPGYYHSPLEDSLVMVKNLWEDESIDGVV
jgi:[ribosomal protein S18]-alanine N-acetyltransferase